MTGYYKKAIYNLEEEIKELTNEQDNFLIFCEKAIELILNTTAELKEYVWKKEFNNQRKKYISSNRLNLCL